jgi:hypothetical protein
VKRARGLPFISNSLFIVILTELFKIIKTNTKGRYFYLNLFFAW